MSFNPFKAVGDYPKMLNKIAASTFFVAIGFTALLSSQFTSVRCLLEPLSIPISISGVSLPLGILLPALLVAILSRIFKLHDRISDVLNIRQRFDVGEILFPLAMGSGASLSVDQVRKIKKDREPMMYKVFYKYASSSPGKAIIETHYITMALDQWCWYWMVLEATFLSLVLAVTFLATARSPLAAIFLAVVLVAVGVLQLIRQLCSDYALQEVEAIVQEPNRRQAVAKEFNAL